jgi:hypothetical protein
MGLGLCTRLHFTWMYAVVGTGLVLMRGPVLERLRRDGGGAWRGIGEAALCLLLGAAPALGGEAVTGVLAQRMSGLSARNGEQYLVAGYLSQAGQVLRRWAETWGGSTALFSTHYDAPFIAGRAAVAVSALWAAAGAWALLTAGRGRGWLVVPLGWVFGVFLWAPLSPQKAVGAVHLFFLFPFLLMAVPATAAHLYGRFRARPAARGAVVALLAVTAGLQAADLAAFAHVLARPQEPANVYERMAGWMGRAASPSEKILVGSHHYYRGFSLMDPRLRPLMVGEEGFTGLRRPPVRDLFNELFRRTAESSRPDGGFYVLLTHDATLIGSGAELSRSFEEWSGDRSVGPPRIAARFLDWDGCVMAEAYRFGRPGTPSRPHARPGRAAPSRRGGEAPAVDASDRYRLFLYDGGFSVTGDLGGWHGIGDYSEKRRYKGRR